MISAIAAFWAFELLAQRRLTGASVGQLVGADRRGRSTEDPDDERRQDEERDDLRAAERPTASAVTAFCGAAAVDVTPAGRAGPLDA